MFFAIENQLRKVIVKVVNGHCVASVTIRQVMLCYGFRALCDEEYDEKINYVWITTKWALY